MRAITILLLAGGLAPALAQHAHQPHAAQARSALPSPPEAQRADIEAGRGAGLAMPAEVNRHPGPMHVLEHAEALGLSESQRSSVEALMPPMRRAAIEAGARFMAAELRLNTLFATADATPDSVRQATGEAAQAQADMRASHLVAHIATRALLTPEQITRYDILRGYRPG